MLFLRVSFGLVNKVYARKLSSLASSLFLSFSEQYLIITDFSFRLTFLFYLRRVFRSFKFERKIQSVQAIANLHSL